MSYQDHMWDKHGIRVDEPLCEICNPDSAPLQSDDWHPVSKPPKPEDFEPTGYILVLHKSTPFPECILKGAHMGTYTHWRNITPPTT